MWKTRCRLTAVAVALCLQCNGSTPAAAPEEAPASEETDETPSPSPDAESAESGESSTPSESADTKDEGKAGGGKKACADLPKNDCKVTVGCAWNDLKKCVDEGPTE